MFHFFFVFPPQVSTAGSSHVVSLLDIYHVITGRHQQQIGHLWDPKLCSQEADYIAAVSKKYPLESLCSLLRVRLQLPARAETDVRGYSCYSYYLERGKKLRILGYGSTVIYLLSLCGSLLSLNEKCIFKNLIEELIIQHTAVFVINFSKPKAPLLLSLLTKLRFTATSFFAPFRPNSGVMRNKSRQM